MLGNWRGKKEYTYTVVGNRLRRQNSYIGSKTKPLQASTAQRVLGVNFPLIQKIWKESQQVENVNYI